MALVVDTNLVVSRRTLVSELIDGASAHNFVVVIPYTVLNELDGLKQRGHVEARQAVAWMHELLAYVEPPGLHVQKLAEVIQHGLNADDAILDCCRYFALRQGNFVALASNDRNLCNRALAEGIPSVTWFHGLTATMLLNEMASRISGDMMVDEEPISRVASAPEPTQPMERPNYSVSPVVQTKSSFMNRRLPEPELMPHRATTTSGQLMRDAQNVLLKNASILIDIRMHEAFDNEELAFLKYETPPQTEREVIGVLDKHRIAVFSPFLRGFHTDILIKNKLGPSKSELTEYVAAWTSLIVRLAQHLEPYKKAAEEVFIVVRKYFS